MADTVLTTLLDVGKEVVDNLLPDLSNDLFGVDMDFYFPISNNSIYGEHDNQFVYPDDPDLSGRYPALGGVFFERWKSDNTMDLYNQQEPYILTVGDLDIPKDTKVIIKMNQQSVLTFRVNTISGFPGNDNFLYRKLFLVPMEIRVT